ncbi:MAG: hypothetical protein QOK04_636 [Solirubrobacteraceae bacterium]|nr:hypothetical protein [Solirubrobacteraceae bacterium]
MPANQSTPPDVEARARTGRRIRALAVVGVLVVLAALVLARGRDRFEGKVVSGEGKKAHVIYQREPFTLAFTDRRQAGTAYQVLYSQAGAVRFFQGRTGAKGKTNKIRVSSVGTRSRVIVRWIVDGKVRARWAFVVRGPRNHGA